MKDLPLRDMMLDSPWVRGGWGLDALGKFFRRRRRRRRPPGGGEFFKLWGGSWGEKS